MDEVYCPHCGSFDVRPLTEGYVRCNQCGEYWREPVRGVNYWLSVGALTVWVLGIIAIGAL